MALALLSAGFQSLPPLPTIKLGPSGADSWVGGLVHTLGPCGSLQRTLLWGWEFLPLLPQPPRVFSIRGLRLYFPTLEPWVARSTSFLLVCLCTNVGLQGLLAVALPSLFHNPPPHWVCQSPSCCKSSPPRLSISAPPTGLDECFFFISLVVGLPCSSIFCQFWVFFVVVLLLVVRGGAVCLPTPPSWPEALIHFFVNAPIAVWTLFNTYNFLYSITILLFLYSFIIVSSPWNTYRTEATT